MSTCIQSCWVHTLWGPPPQQFQLWVYFGDFSAALHKINLLPPFFFANQLVLGQIGCKEFVNCSFALFWPLKSTPHNDTATTTFHCEDGVIRMSCGISFSMQFFCNGTKSLILVSDGHRGCQHFIPVHLITKNTSCTWAVDLCSFFNLC